MSLRVFQIGNIDVITDQFETEDELIMNCAALISEAVMDLAKWAIPVGRVAIVNGIARAYPAAGYADRRLHVGVGVESIPGNFVGSKQ
jgi:hypothetical protein